MQEMEEQLINEVKKYKEIYAKNTLEYRNKTKRAQAWRNISKLLNKSEVACIARWRTLRDRYIRESNKIQQASGSATTYPESLWEYYDSLEFLRDHVKPRKKTSSADETISNTSIEFEDDVCIKYENIEFDEECVSIANKINDEGKDVGDNTIYDRSYSINSTIKTNHHENNNASNNNTTNPNNFTNNSNATNNSNTNNTGNLSKESNNTTNSNDFDANSSNNTPKRFQKRNATEDALDGFLDKMSMLAAKRFCAPTQPTQSDEHDPFFSMVRNYFRKMTADDIEDSKIFFLNYLHKRNRNSLT